MRAESLNSVWNPPPTSCVRSFLSCRYCDNDIIENSFGYDKSDIVTACFSLRLLFWHFSFICDRQGRERASGWNWIRAAVPVHGLPAKLPGQPWRQVFLVCLLRTTTPLPSDVVGDTSYKPVCFKLTLSSGRNSAEMQYIPRDKTWHSCLNQSHHNWRAHEH